MNELINEDKKITIAQNTLMNHTSTRISELEMKNEQMESDLEETIDTK